MGSQIQNNSSDNIYRCEESNDLIEIRKSKLNGGCKGVFAKTEIPKGSFICTYHGKLLIHKKGSAIMKTCGQCNSFNVAEIPIGKLI